MSESTDSPESRVVSQIRVRATLFLVLAVAAGGGAVMLVKQYLDRVRGAAEASVPDTAPVVVAALDIPIAMRLEERHLQVTYFPEQFVPEGAFTQIDEVVDKTVRQNIVKGEPILNDRLADEDEGRGLAALLADGMRAMAVEVDAVVGVAGFVQPGDYVDVITTMEPDEQAAKVQDEASKISKIILQYIRVLAVGEHLSTSGHKPIKVKVVTLGVTPAEAERLALASQHGDIQLALRSRVDQKLEATLGITPQRLLTPDQGASEAVQPAPEERRTFRFQRKRRPARKREPVEPTKPEEPAAPKVEILRGSKIEERTLRAPTE